MSKIEFEMMVTEIRYEAIGPNPDSTATVPFGPVGLVNGLQVDGHLTFRGLKVQIGQKLRVEVELVEGDGDPASLNRRSRREPIIEPITY